MERDNLDSISAFSEVVAGRSTRYTNWSPSSDPGEGLTLEELEAVAKAINRYAPY